MKYLVPVVSLFFMSCVALADGPPSEPPMTAPKITFDASGEKLSGLMERVKDQIKARISIEEAADVKVSASVSDIPLEDALSAVCESAGLEWRRVYVGVDCPLLKKPNALAATVRLMLGLQFPDLLVDKTSTRKNLVHLALKRAVEAIPVSLRKQMGLVEVYLITNDKAAKLAKEESEKKSNVEKYAELVQEAMKLFMEMSPEEREQAMATGMRQIQQFDPNYMMEMTKSVLTMDPGMLRNLMQSQTDMLFSMSPDERRALMRMQMQAQLYLTPEQREVLMEDAKTVMEELKELQQE